MPLRKKYQPDLKAFMALCEANYAKLCRLLPQDLQQAKLNKNFKFLISQQPPLRVQLIQNSRYTQTFKLSQKDSSKGSLSREFIVRLYHDAQLAEILSGVNDSMLAPVYPLPNEQMKQVDEKLQLNRFLGEWLSFCLEYGEIHLKNKTQLVFFG